MSDMREDGPSHLIERAAARLRGVGGLTAPPPVERTRLREDAGAAEPTQADILAGDTLRAGAHGGEVAELAPPPPLPDVAPSDAAPSEATGRRPGVAATARGPDGRVPPAAEPLPDGALMIDFPALEQGGLVVGRKTRTRISEEFRIAVGGILRTIQTAYSSGSSSANLLMITSARPGEGKSFTALNIAGSIAQHGQREVVLVDVDAKQRPITHQLGQTEVRGLLDLAANPNLRVEDVLVRTAIPNLTFLPIGNRNPEAVPGATARPISAVVERLGRRFANRVVILDAPPCLSTSDPSALAPLVGQIIMVVEAERTQRNEVEAAFDLVKSCPTVTLLLNKIQLTTSYTFGAYHYFGSYS